MAILLRSETLADLNKTADDRWFKLINYWVSMRKHPDQVPAKNDIDVTALPARLLPDLMLVDRIPAQNLRGYELKLRLAGNSIAEMFQVRHGDIFEALMPNMKALGVLDPYDRCLKGEIVFAGHSLKWKNAQRDILTYHKLLLPLTRSGGEIDTVFAMIIFDDRGIRAEHRLHTQKSKFRPSLFDPHYRGASSNFVQWDWQLAS